MGISYRLKKKELIALLDFSGNVNSLEQKFGDIFISREEHRETVKRLQEKGMITVSGNTAVPESHISFVMKRFYESPVVLADEKLAVWIYYSEKIIVSVTESSVFGLEYTVCPVVSGYEREEFFRENAGKTFTFFRGGSGQISGDSLSEITGGNNYEG